MPYTAEKERFQVYGSRSVYASDGPAMNEWSANSRKSVPPTSVTVRSEMRDASILPPMTARPVHIE